MNGIYNYRHGFGKDILGAHRMNPTDFLSCSPMRFTFVVFGELFFWITITKNTFMSH